MNGGQLKINQHSFIRDRNDSQIYVYKLKYNNAIQYNKEAIQ